MIPTTEPWPAEQLHEARAILADVIHHPETRAALAARVIAAYSSDEAERAEAHALRCMLEPALSARARSHGGAA